MVDSLVGTSAVFPALEGWGNPHQQIVVTDPVPETTHPPTLAQESQVSSIRWVENKIWLHLRLRLIRLTAC